MRAVPDERDSSSCLGGLFRDYTSALKDERMFPYRLSSWAQRQSMIWSGYHH